MTSTGFRGGAARKRTVAGTKPAFASPACRYAAMRDEAVRSIGAEVVRLVSRR